MPNRRALRNEIALLGGISVNDVFIVSISGSFGRWGRALVFQGCWGGGKGENGGGYRLAIGSPKHQRKHSPTRPLTPRARNSNLNNVTFAIEEDSVAEATEAMDAVVAGFEADGGDSLGSWDVSSYSSNRAATGPTTYIGPRGGAFGLFLSDCCVSLLFLVFFFFSGSVYHCRLPVIV